MAELPDGMVMKYFENCKKATIDFFTDELIKCKHCDFFLPDCSICTAWGSKTEREGWCFQAERKKKGHWYWEDEEYIYHCDRCGFEIDAEGCIDPIKYINIYKYCPNCGAKMEVEN